MGIKRGGDTTAILSQYQDQPWTDVGMATTDIKSDGRWSVLNLEWVVLQFVVNGEE